MQQLAAPAAPAAPAARAHLRYPQRLKGADEARLELDAGAKQARHGAGAAVPQPPMLRVAPAIHLTTLSEGQGVFHASRNRNHLGACGQVDRGRGGQDAEQAAGQATMHAGDGTRHCCTALQLLPPLTLMPAPQHRAGPGTHPAAA